MHKNITTLTAVVASALLIASCSPSPSSSPQTPIPTLSGSPSKKVEEIVSKTGVSEISQVVIFSNLPSISYQKDGLMYSATWDPNGNIEQTPANTQFFAAALPVDNLDIEKLEKETNSQLTDCTSGLLNSSLSVTPAKEALQQFQCLNADGTFAKIVTSDGSGNKLPSFDNWRTEESIDTLLKEVAKYVGSQVSKINFVNPPAENPTQPGLAFVEMGSTPCTTGQACTTMYTRGSQNDSADSSIAVETKPETDTTPKETFDISTVTVKDILYTLEHSGPSEIDGSQLVKADLSSIDSLVLTVDKGVILVRAKYADHRSTAELPLIKEGTTPTTSSTAPPAPATPADHT